MPRSFVDLLNTFPVNAPHKLSAMGKNIGHKAPGRLAVSILAGAMLTTLACAQPLTWQWSNPLPHGNNCYDLAINNWIAFMAGDRGRFYTSPDYEFWIPRETGTVRALRGIAFLSDKVVITGENGTVVHAPLDALDNLSVVNLGTEDWLESVAVGNGVAVAVGDNGAVYTSSDALQWTRRPQTFNTWLRSVAFGAGTFVTVGESGFVATSANGVSWTKRSSGTTLDLNRVAWLTNRFVAVGNKGLVLVSTTGTTWSSLTGSGITNDLYLVAGYYPASGILSPTILVGGDSELRLFEKGAWSDQTATNKVFPAPKWEFYSAFWDGSAFLVGGSTGLLLEGFKYENTDWVWVERSDSLRPWLWDICRIGTTFLAVGNRGTIMTSTDGVQWTTELVPSEALGSVLLGVGGSEDTFVAVGSSGTILTSTNAVEWSIVIPPPVTNDLQGITFWKGRFFATGGGGKVLTSADGRAWALHTTLGNNFLSGIAGTTDRLVVVGQQGAIFTTADGNSWTSAQSGTTNWLYRVRAFDGSWVAVGQNGTILSSSDGEHWIARQSGTSQWLNDICSFNGKLYAVGTQGTVLVSTNTESWHEEGTITQKSLLGAVSDVHQLISVGVEGVILRGQSGPLTILDYRRIDGTNALAVSGPPGRSVTIQASEDTRAWSNLATVEILANNGLLLFMDSPTNPPPHQIFRAATP